MRLDNILFLGDWVYQLMVCAAKKLLFEIAPLRAVKKSVKFITLQCILNPFGAKNSDFLGKNSCFF